MICVTGCGRSGTTFSTHLFSKIGMDCPHEKLGKDGICSWMIGVISNEPYVGPCYSDLDIDTHMFHQVRHPLHTISSLQTFGNKTWNYIRKFIPIEPTDNIILKGMKYWYFWNMSAEKICEYTYQVEKIKNEIHILSKKGNFQDKVPSNISEICDQLTAQKVNTRKYKPLTWEDLYNIDPELCFRIKELAKRYGYGV